MPNFLNSNKRSLQDQLVLFGTGLPCFFLFPFSFYRFWLGDYAIAMIDLYIGVGLVVIFLQTWYGKKIKYVNEIAVTAFLIGVSWIMHLRGPSLIFWVFPSMGFSYFVLKSKYALLWNIGFLIGVTFLFIDILTKAEILSMYPSFILVCLFGYAFSLCSETQNEKLMEKASTDSLTGIKNRFSLDEKVSEILASHKRHPKPVSMLVLDLDFFKNINDTYGHKEGDDVLKGFAQAVQTIIRSSDFVYRFGGEEFIVIAQNSSLENAGILAESIRAFVVQHPSLSKYNMTVSIGVAEIADNDDANSWFRRADRALYESKDLGRNRVTLAMLDDSDQIQCEGVQKDKTIRPISNKSHTAIRGKNNSGHEPSISTAEESQTNTATNASKPAGKPI